MDEKFYRDGVNFSCRGCGKCCRIPDGVVYLTDADILRLAKFFRCESHEFLKKYTHRDQKFRVLNDFPNGDCVFFKEGHGCIAYTARPSQCRFFPFWGHVMLSRATWDDTAQECPGMNSGKLWTYAQIEKLLRGEEENE